MNGLSLMLLLVVTADLQPTSEPSPPVVELPCEPPARPPPPPIPVPPPLPTPPDFTNGSEGLDVWGWRAGLPDAAPSGWYVSEEMRFLRGRADMDNQKRNRAIGKTAAPRLEFCGRNGEGLGGAIAFAYLVDAHVDELGVRRSFKSGLLDLDLLLWELRPLRPVRMSARVGVGINWLSYRRVGGGDPASSLVATTNDLGPLVAVGAGAASAAINTVGNILFEDDAVDIDLIPTAELNGAAANPRAQEVLARSFTGASIHAGLDETVMLGRSGFALFASGDARGVGGVNDSAVAVTARVGVKGFRRFGRYRVQLAAGYCWENWWLYQSGFDETVGSESMATFRFHGPFGQAEFKF